jgi:hypothetical protein
MIMKSDRLWFVALELVATLEISRNSMKCYSEKMRQEVLQLFETRKCPI